MRTQQVLQTISIKAGSELEYSMRFIGYDGNYPSAGGSVLGVLDAKTSRYEMAPVNTYGITLVETGGIIARGSAVATDSAGRAVALAALSAEFPSGETAVKSDAAQPDLTFTGGALPVKACGYALDASAGAGDFIRVKLV